MNDFETLLYEEGDGVAWITLNRPDVMNAFNSNMMRELQSLWRELRRSTTVRCIVLTGAGNRAFCAGIDRNDVIGSDPTDPSRVVGVRSNVYHFDDPGHFVGPKACDLWIPVISMVNGIACGGAFYLLGESEFIIAAEHATFFDPHVTFGTTAAYESIQMLQKMPFGEIMRLSLLGSHERMSSQRAHSIGLVSEVVPAEELRERTAWAAGVIASQPAIAVQGTVRSLWLGRELGRSQALGMGYAMISMGNDRSLMNEGQDLFSSGQRVDWRLR